MVPTEAGKLLYTQIAQAVDSLEHLTHALNHKEGRRHPQIRIGSPQEYFYTKGLDVCTHTDYRFILTFDVASKLIDLLTKGELDLVICSQRLNESGLEYVLLDREEFILLGPPALTVPLLNTELEFEHWLMQQDWISYGSELPIIRRFWFNYFQKRPSLVPKYIFPDLRVIVKAIERGKGVSVVPSYLCNDSIQKGLCQAIHYPQEVEVSNDIWLVYRKTNFNDETIMSVVNSLIKNSVKD